MRPETTNPEPTIVFATKGAVAEIELNQFFLHGRHHVLAQQYTPGIARCGLPNRIPTQLLLEYATNMNACRAAQSEQLEYCS